MAKFFDRPEIRNWLAVAWLISFVVLVLLFQFLILPNKIILSQIEAIEDNLSSDNWDQAAQEIYQLDQFWKDQQIRVQANNGTTEVSNFEKMLTQIKREIELKDSDALVTVATLKSAAKAITSVIPGP